MSKNTSVFVISLLTGIGVSGLIIYNLDSSYKHHTDNPVLTQTHITPLKDNVSATDNSTIEIPIYNKPPEHLPINQGCSTPMVLSVVWYMKKYPNDWHFDGYRVNFKDIGVWTANGIDYLDIDKKENALVSISKFTPACRRLLWTNAKLVEDADSARQMEAKLEK